MSASWRDTSHHFIGIGRQLATIEMIMREVAATAVVEDKQAAARLGEALRAARRLVRRLEGLRMWVDGEELHQ